MSSIRQSQISAIDFYAHAREAVLASSYCAEVEWQNQISIFSLRETDFLREAAWVILNSGFKESIARQKFSHLSMSFGDWQSAEFINQNRHFCISCALDGFGHEKKITAMADIAREIAKHGFSEFHKSLIQNPITKLNELPFIGPITVWHLAKNIGCDVAKPDRHLVRLSKNFGFDCVHTFCQKLSSDSGDRVAVVDLILWRYSASF